MRPFIGFVLLILAAVGLAMFASRLHPGEGLPPNEVQAEKDQQTARDEQAKVDNMKASVDRSSEAFDKVKSGAIQATLQLDGKAPIKVELYPKAAPKTVAQISGLIKKHFYDGIKVHRVEDGSHILKLFQFGDPESINAAPSEFDAQKIGTHGTGTMVPLEIKLPHAKYSIGMARSQAADSGDSQMYINTDANPNLDGNYCVFGMVVGGQDVLATVKVGDQIKSFSIP